MRTMTLKTGGTDFGPGWKNVVVKNAKYGDWNGTKFLDLTFEGYPDTLNARVYATTGKNGEEFAIGQVFRFANAGISGGLEGPEGTKVMRIDDEPSNLRGSHLNAYFYKDGEYSKILKQFAPTVFHNDVEGFNENDVTYWKSKAEKYYHDYVLKGKHTASSNSQPVEEYETVDEADAIPF